MAADTVLYWRIYKIADTYQLRIRRTSSTGYSQVTLGGYMPWNDPEWSGSGTDPAIASIAIIEEEMHPKYLTNFFNGLWKMTTIVGIENLYTDECLDMTRAFLGCWELDYLDLSHFDTSNVTSMYNMFGGCSKLEYLNISNFNTSNVTNMDSMFSGCKLLTPLDVSNFDTSNVTSMFQMFFNCQSLISLDLSGFDTSNITEDSAGYMFGSCLSLRSLNLSGFNTSTFTSMAHMFYNCQSLTSLDLSDFDTSNVTDIYNMFYGCKSLTSLNLSGFDTSNVDNMTRMFSDCQSLTSLDLSDFDTANVVNMSYMFNNCKSLTSLNLSGFDTSNVTKMNYMFNKCSSLTSLNLSDFDTANVVNMSYMFNNCNSLTTLNISSFNTANVTKMNYMFNNCSSLTSLNLSSFNTSNVTTMQNMFYNCNSLTSLNVSGWNTLKVEDMSVMFDSCSSLTSLDVSSFNTSNVLLFESMFHSCNSLYSIDITNFTFKQNSSADYIFGGNPGIEIIYFPTTQIIPFVYGLFDQNNAQHYLFNKNNSASASVVTFWKNFASQYTNIHYEFDDNPLPTVSNFSVLRVGSNGSKEYNQQGQYAYLKVSALAYSNYIPTGYTNNFKQLNTKIDGSSETITWIYNSSTNAYEAWYNTGDGDTHTFDVSASDSISKNNVEVKSNTSAPLRYVLSKIFTLVDYYHESDSTDPEYGKEGIAFGKYATNANLFDCDMPTKFTNSVDVSGVAIFKNSVVIERLIGEIKTYAGIVVPNGWLECDGSEVLIEDYPLLAAALGADHPDPDDPDYIKPVWGTPTSYDSFILPDLTGRTPIGASNSTEWVTLIRENPSSTFTLNTPTYCRIGNGTSWSNEALLPSGTYTASYASLTQYFPTDPASGVTKVIQAKLTVGSSGGESEHILTTNEMPTHTHIQDSHGHSLTNAGYFLYNTASAGVDRKTVKSGSGASNMLHSDGVTSRPGSTAVGNTATNQNTGGSLSHSLMQPFAVVKYIICAA